MRGSWLTTISAWPSLISKPASLIPTKGLWVMININFLLYLWFLDLSCGNLEVGSFVVPNFPSHHEQIWLDKNIRLFNRAATRQNLRENSNSIILGRCWNCFCLVDLVMMKSFICASAHHARINQTINVNLRLPIKSREITSDGEEIIIYDHVCMLVWYRGRRGNIQNLWTTLPVSMLLNYCHSLILTEQDL